MADSTATLTCVLCGVFLDGNAVDQATCQDCRSPTGKIDALDMAIRVAVDAPDRFANWPAIRRGLRKFCKTAAEQKAWEKIRNRSDIATLNATVPLDTWQSICKRAPWRRRRARHRPGARQFVNCFDICRQRKISRRRGQEGWQVT